MISLISGWLVVVAFRRTRLGEARLPLWLLAPAGAGVGLRSAVAGIAGPLGATVFVSLKLPSQSYVGSKAVTAVLIHLTRNTCVALLALPRE